jgi:hypothetical protein
MLVLGWPKLYRSEQEQPQEPDDEERRGHLLILLFMVRIFCLLFVAGQTG